MLTADEFVENFEFLDDWDARYAYLVELGEAMPPLDERLRTDENRVQGASARSGSHRLPTLRGMAGCAMSGTAIRRSSGRARGAGRTVFRSHAARSRRSTSTPCSTVSSWPST